jgi:hypothetical protein
MADTTMSRISLAGEPIAWQEAAREYVLAANYLLDWYDVSRLTPEAAAFEFSHHGAVAPLMVLYAIAVENLLKALRVARDGTPVVEGKLARDFKHHRLLDHASKAGVRLSADETGLLRRLRDFIEAGRYPVPAAEGGTPDAWRFNFPRDVDSVWLFLERLESDLMGTGHPVLPPTDLRARHRPPGYALP